MPCCGNQASAIGFALKVLRARYNSPTDLEMKTMKRLITIALFVLPLAAFTAPALALEDRFDEEFYDGLGNK